MQILVSTNSRVCLHRGQSYLHRAELVHEVRNAQLMLMRICQASDIHLQGETTFN